MVELIDSTLISNYILAGGLSSRMGGKNKAKMLFGHSTMLEHILKAFQLSQLHSSLVVSNPINYASVGCKVILADLYQGLGPLGGLITALSLSKSQLNFISACDMPMIKPTLLKFMIAKALALYKKNEAFVLMPCINGKKQPLLAIYSKEVLPFALKLKLEGKKRMKDLITFPINSILLTETELIPYDQTLKSLININTDKDLLQAQAMVNV